MSESKTPYPFQKAQVKSSQRAKLYREPKIYFSSEIWDKLSTIYLTKNALKELNRRNKGLDTVEFLTHHNLQISQESLEAVRKIAREGGPDLTDLRGYPEISYFTMAPSENQSGGLSRPENSTHTGGETKITGPYDKQFETLLKKGGVYPEDGYDSDIEVQDVPGNLEEMIRRANEPHPTLLITQAQFLGFRKALNRAERESEVVALVVPLLEGQFRVSNQGYKDTTFSNLAPLVSQGIEGEALVKGTPDRCYGTPFERLDEKIRNELSSFVVPTIDPTQSIAPNFFLELKGPGGHDYVAKRQALYYGALGERAQIALRSWGHPELVLDGLAHTICCTFVTGILRFSSVHATPSKIPSRQAEYFIHANKTYDLIENRETLQNAIVAYHNLQEYAEEMREESIRLANSG